MHASVPTCTRKRERERVNMRQALREGEFLLCCGFRGQTVKLSEFWLDMSQNRLQPPERRLASQLSDETSERSVLWRFKYSMSSGTFHAFQQTETAIRPFN